MAVPNDPNVDPTTVNQKIHVLVNDQIHNYTVSGIIYYGSGHFIIRMFNRDHQWVYDGILKPLPQLCEDTPGSDLNNFLGKILVLSYIQK